MKLTLRPSSWLRVATGLQAAAQLSDLLQGEAHTADGLLGAALLLEGLLLLCTGALVACSSVSETQRGTHCGTHCGTVEPFQQAPELGLL